MFAYFEIIFFFLALNIYDFVQAQDSSCCHHAKDYSPCREACDQLATTKSESRLKHLLQRLPSYCPESMGELWVCINASLPGASKNLRVGLDLDVVNSPLLLNVGENANWHPPRMIFQKYAERTARLLFTAVSTEMRWGQSAAVMRGATQTAESTAKLFFGQTLLLPPHKLRQLKITVNPSALS